MAYVISEYCVNCGHCARRCPAQAIVPGDGHYVIHGERCVECNLCAMVCPVGAAHETQ